MRRFAHLFLLLSFLLAVPSGFAQQSIPALLSRVTDLAGVLSSGQKAALELRLLEIEKKSGSQVAVLLVQSTTPESLEEFSLRVVEKWKLGRRKIDDGVLFLAAIGDRKMRIEAGYALEGGLNDAVCRRIIDELIKPHFKNGDYATGITAGIEQIARIIAGESLPPPGLFSGAPEGAAKSLGLITIIAIVVGAGLHNIIGRPASATLASGAVLVLAGIFQGFLVALILAVVVFVIVLFGKASPAGSIRHSRSNWSSRSSGGGFSGGGGRFGGGGASGSW